MRPLPELTPENEHYWKAGADGVLRTQWCASCDLGIHPPLPTCPHCAGDLDIRDLSGRGTVVGVTVNHQQWLPDLIPPYAVVVVALDEDPLVRITSLIVEADPESVEIGLPVEVRFEQQDDIWLPLFTPTGESVVERDEWPQPPLAPVRPMPTTERFEDAVAISGIGMSDVGRRLDRDPLSLAVDACRAAVADAGLALDDIDGLSTYPGGMGGGGGFSEGGIHAVEEALRIHPTWFSGGGETSGQNGSIVNAMLAVSAGLCRHVLCFRTVWESTSTLRGNRRGSGVPAAPRMGGEMQWRLPYGAMSAANWIAVNASHHFHRYGTTREQLGWIPVTQRRHAGLNPAAIYRDPMTIENYLEARMVTTPFGLYDCDVPCDGSVAVVVSALDAARDLAHPAIRVGAVGTQLRERIPWDQGTLVHEQLVWGPAQHLWSRTDLTPDDVDLACLYDGFSFNCLTWLEALGFCGPGEGGAFVEGGERISLGGSLPLNTHGGQLSGGRTHGYGFVHEAVVQLRGDADQRQVAGAEVAVTSSGGGHPGGAILFTTDRG